MRRASIVLGHAVFTSNATSLGVPKCRVRNSAQGEQRRIGELSSDFVGGSAP